MLPTPHTKAVKELAEEINNIIESVITYQSFNAIANGLKRIEEKSNKIIGIIEDVQNLHIALNKETAKKLEELKRLDEDIDDLTKSLLP